MSHIFLEYPDREILAMDLANQLAGDLRAALAQNDSVAFAVPGGTSPGPVFDALSGVNLDWERVSLLLSDERWVPEDSDRSNTRLLRQRLMTDRAAAAQMLPLYLPAETPEERIDEMAAKIAPHVPLDVVLLGMGTDLHTASIFPGADMLVQALAPGAPVLLAMRAPGAPEPRITLSAEVLNGALRKHVLIFGREKRDALERARTLSPLEAPIRAVLDDATVHWAE